MGDQAVNNQRVIPQPFPDGIEEDKIAKIVTSEVLHDVGGRWDNIVWCPCAWSPDSMYFAHTSGRSGSVIQLIPWNRYKHCLLSKDDRSNDGYLIQLKPRSFNAGETVCSLAIGSSQAETKPDSTQLDWSRYKYRHMRGLNVAAGTRSGQIRVWNIDNAVDYKPLVLLDHSKTVSDMRFAPDGSLRLLSCSYDGRLKVWHLRDDGNMTPTLSSEKIDGNRYRKFNGVAWSPDCKLVCGVGTASGVFVWELASKKGRKFRADNTEVKGHLHDAQACDFSPDGALLVTSSRDTKVLVWDPYTGEALRQFLHLHPPPTIAFAGGASNSYVRGISFSHDGRNIATICDDGYLRVWDLFCENAPRALLHITDGLSCYYSPQGADLLVSSADMSLHVLEAPMRVSSLRHYCRLALRRMLDRDNLDCLYLHDNLLHYLQYVDFDSEAIPPLKERIQRLFPGRRNSAMINGQV